MDGWRDMARDSIQAARLCMSRNRARSAVSRAYYAVFSGLTARLREISLTPPANRESWAHESMPRLFMTHLRDDFELELANEVNRRVRASYRERVISDYVSEDEVDERDARRAVSNAEAILGALGIPA